jgi:hypothetical protein
MLTVSAIVDRFQELLPEGKFSRDEHLIITGGEPILSYFVSTVTGEASVVGQDLSTVRELGNSIIAGGTTTTSSTDGTNVFPDGPDMVTVCVRNLSGAAVTSASLNGRLSWTEAQA